MTALQLITTLILDGNTGQATKELEAAKQYKTVFGKPSSLSDLQIVELEQAVKEKELGL